MIEPIHGGNASPEMLDFSANIDAHGPPAAVRWMLARAALIPSRLRAYPSSRESAAARAALGAAIDVEPESIVLTAGGAGAIDAAVRLVATRAFALPVPAFSEYERAIVAAGKAIVPVPLRGDWTLDVPGFLTCAMTAGGAIVNSPHNPSGAALERRDLVAIAEGCEERGCDLIVDEAFVDYVPERSIVREAAAMQSLVVVRSLTKFYGIAGMRLGYAVLHPDRARRMRARLPSWALGRIELEVVRALARSEVYARRTRERNAGARTMLAERLARIGITVFPSQANFLLLALPVVETAFDGVLAELARRHGIVVRDCRSYRGLEDRSMIRVAILGARANRRLERALVEVLRLR